MDSVPEGSIYFWMYRQGLRHVPFEQMLSALAEAGKEVRPKDERNFWAGWYNSDLYGDGARSRSILSLDDGYPRSRRTCFEMEWHEYPPHPYAGMPEVPNRWVPCTRDGRPLIKWGRSCMLRSEAEAVTGFGSIAENLKGCMHIVVDFDGDHGEGVDLDLVRFGNMLARTNRQWSKPKSVAEYGVNHRECMDLLDKPASFHLDFVVDRVVPTMHFPKAHIDVIGNQRNSIRYFKDKVCNMREAMPMDDATWKAIMDYAKEKEGEG